MTRARHSRRLARLEAVAASRASHPLTIDVTGLKADALRIAEELKDQWQSSREAQQERGLTPQPVVSSYQLWANIKEAISLDSYEDFTTVLEHEVMDRISGGDPTRPFFLLRTFCRPAGPEQASSPVADCGRG